MNTDGDDFMRVNMTQPHVHRLETGDFVGKKAAYKRKAHTRWFTGLLIDHCDLLNGRIEFIHRNTAGAGHGWSIGINGALLRGFTDPEENQL